MIAVPHEKWDERPLAVCVLREGQTATAGRAARVPRAELRQVLAARTRSSSCDEIPKTAVGKFRKTALREQFAKQPTSRVVEISGRTFLVTGGKSGLGEATARLLESEGRGWSSRTCRRRT